MTFQPVIPTGGLAGWRFLERTYAAQIETFSASASIARDTDYFAERIGSIQSAADLVTDRRLLGVALGAFGLQDDLNNRYFIRKVLEDGTGSRDALANRLPDERYKKLSDAFGFGPGQTVRTRRVGFAETTIAQFRQQSFAIAVGQQDETMRITLNLQRELPAIVTAKSSEDAQWFSVMGQPPLRQFFETALGLPKAFGQLDIDRQLEVFRDKAQRAFGTDRLAELAQPDNQQVMINTYLARAQVSAFAGGTSGASVALTLLQSAYIPG